MPPRNQGRQTLQQQDPKSGSQRLTHKLTVQPTTVDAPRRQPNRFQPDPNKPARWQ